MGKLTRTFYEIHFQKNELISYFLWSLYEMAVFSCKDRNDSDFPHVIDFKRKQRGGFYLSKKVQFAPVDNMSFMTRIVAVGAFIL